MGARARSAVAAGLTIGGLWLGGVGATASAEPVDGSRPATSGEPSEDPPRVAPPSAAEEPSARRGIGTKWRRPHRGVRDVDREPTEPCSDDGGKDCGPGWPWPWPWPRPGDPEPPGIPDPTPPESHGGVSDRPVVAPRPGGIGTSGVGAPQTRPPVELPLDPDVLDVVPGAGLPAAGAGAPITLPVLPVFAPATAAGPGVAAPRVAEAPAAPAAPPRAVPEPAPARPAEPVENILAGSPPPAPTRVGYGETLRTAGTSQLAALALPGVAGIVILTAAGGVLGYRQARAGQAVRARGTARFMN
ncbi:MAG: hypothetical protein PGN37_19955 [Mycobacterium kyogaense]|uniref:hypothetical protein n=1 Tax=Mycobacterium kyogaense TaxID=2212479 RepID=UPI002FF55F8E